MASDTLSASSLLYTEDDIEQDTLLYFNEEVDLSSYSVISTTEENLSQGIDRDTLVEDDLDRFILDHFKQLRCLKFAKSAVEAEVKRSQRISSATQRYSRPRRDSWEIVESTIQCNQYDSVPQLSSSFSFPMNILLSNIRASHAPENTSFEARAKQLKKDLERDRLLLNNQRLIGAAIGMAGIMSRVSTLLDELLAEKALPLLPADIKDTLCYEILFKSSRTHSGALAFHALQNLIDQQTMMLLPQSSIAPPIKIQISLDTIPSSASTHSCSNADEWGLVAKVSCEFIYMIQRRDDDGILPATAHDQSTLKEEENKSIASQLVNQAINVLYEDFVYFPIVIGRVLDSDSDASHIITQCPAGHVRLTLAN
mmetsp:Transcript_16696/g.18082  ORF Transcript_16696/g.18082 Transcript_16696/m.18082 type:complete len:369 (-) Transcript_16696:26-1132(-)